MNKFLTEMKLFGLVAAFLVSGCSTRSNSDSYHSISKSEIEKVVRLHAAEVKACYNKQLQSSEVAGRLKFQWKVQPDGSVSDVEVIELMKDGDSLARCISQSVETWKFAKFEGQEPALVSWMWQFSKKE